MPGLVVHLVRCELNGEGFGGEALRAGSDGNEGYKARVFEGGTINNDDG